MTTAQVDGFFQTYACAFSKGDVAAICGLWDCPSFMSYQGRHVALDREAFAEISRAFAPSTPPVGWLGRQSRF